MHQEAMPTVPLLRSIRAAGAILACAALAGACSSPDREPGALVVFGPLEDVLGGAGDGAALAGPLPAEFLVGDAGQVEVLLGHRARLAAAAADGARRNTVVDVSRLAALDRTALADGLLEAALEDGGPILLDPSGATAASLRAGQPGPRRVRLDAAGRIAGSEELSAGGR